MQFSNMTQIKKDMTMRFYSSTTEAQLASYVTSDCVIIEGFFAVRTLYIVEE